MGGNKVLGDRESLAVGVFDRGRDDLALRVRHESTHTGDVSNLEPVTTCTRCDHAVDGVVTLGHFGLESNRDFDVGVGPDLDEFLVALKL